MRWLHFGLVPALALGLGTHAFAQNSSQPSASKWRPKDGVYAVPGTGFGAQCGDMNGAFVELAANSIGGDEDHCKISKMTDSASSTVKLEATCDGVQASAPSRQVFLLKRIDDNTFLWRQITPGKKTDRGTKFSYCPEEIQLLYRENAARDKAEAEQKAARERAQQKQ